MSENRKKIVITGAKGLIGWHAHARLHAENCAAEFNGLLQPFEIIALGHADFEDDAKLERSLSGADAVLHFAGVNRAPDDEVEAANPAIASRLVDACRRVKVSPHIVYANSTHANQDTPYGRSKRIAGELLSSFAARFTNLVLPHIFGEGAKPFYNNVTATLIQQLLDNDEITVNPDGKVDLLHAGSAVQQAIEAVVQGTVGTLRPDSYPISVPQLYEKLKSFHDEYDLNLYPDFTNDFDLALFNTYRVATYPTQWPRALKLHTDSRGTLFEAVKGGGGGQSFLSTTKPGITRGDHFHLGKVERFLVVKGEAIIRIRKVLGEQVWEFRVSGDKPAPVDMPTLHTHSIENVGDTELLTLFWTHELFNPEYPDTYADKVLEK